VIDLRVLEHMEEEFISQNKTAVLYILSTEVSQRRLSDIEKMESDYNWPVAHREGLPDLSGGEAAFYAGVQDFNARSKNIKVVFINQFGFCRDCCGQRMPDEMEMMDIRKGSDVEFGQSIYEPFGIAQLEPLSFGGICVITNVCGCAGFVKDVTMGQDTKNVIFADYTDLGQLGHLGLEEMLNIDEKVRDEIEHSLSRKIALEICARLPKNESETQELIESGYALARNMSWDCVVENYLLKSLENAAHKHRHYESCAGA